MKRIISRSILLLVTGGLALAAMILPLSPSLSAVSLQEGDVASQDILAPLPVRYTSEVLTQQQREAAARAVAPVYDLLDTSVARRQVERLRAALAYITSVRADPYASQEQKTADLEALEEIALDDETVASIFDLGDDEWKSVQQESIKVLEQVMQRTIREDRLQDTRRSVPASVSLSLPEDEAEIVAKLAAAFVAPNSFFNEQQTEIARQEASEAVAPVERSFAAGETVVERGEIVSPEDVEALEQLGLTQPQRRWQDRAGAVIIVLISMSLVTIYLRRNPNKIDLRGLVLLAVLFLIFLIGARLTYPTNPIVPFLYPIPAYALILTSLFGAEPALVMTFPLIFLTTYDVPNALELTLYYGLSSVFGVLMPRRAQRVTAYLWIGMTVAATGTAVITSYRLLLSDTDWATLSMLGAAAIFNGVASAGITVLMQYFLAPMLGLTTPLQLLELSRPDHPLLEYLLRNAPGTYQHSLQVANLAEQAAERIEADSFLTRVGALYHDVGKVRNPLFFIENQIGEHINPHDDMEPVESATIIIRHVPDGLELAREYGLPRRILDFIAEHHGTLKTNYQYTQAVNAAGGDVSKVDLSPFQYPGPRPQSRETALVMLADGCEARVRAQRPSDAEELRAIVEDTVQDRIANGQLDDTNLTLRDLSLITETYAASLRGTYHPRVEYPSMIKPGEEGVGEPPTQPLKSKSGQNGEIHPVVANPTEAEQETGMDDNS
ncbi:MAG: HDIG domain-containing protein [Anaerolineales bacterium]